MSDHVADDYEYQNRLRVQKGEVKMALDKKKARLKKSNRVYKAIKNFEAVQDKYSDWGACDTEPNCTFKFILRRHLSEKPVEFSPSGDSDSNMWELFSSMSGWKRANRALTTACKKVLTALDKATYKEIKEVDEWFGDVLPDGQ